MSKQSPKTLFSKYFLNYMIIIVTAVIVMLALILYTILNYSETQIGMYRTRLEDQVNQIIRSTADNCTDMFIKISSIQSVTSFFNSDPASRTELELSRYADPIRNALTSTIVSESYIQSAYIYSTANNTVMSNKSLEINPDLSKYLWYTDDFKNQMNTQEFWNAQIIDKASAGSYTAIYKKLGSYPKGDIFAVILINLSLIKNDIARISADSNGQFMLYDCSGNKILLSTGSDDFSYAVNNTYKKSKITFSKYSYSSLHISEYNWKCIYKYDNIAALKSAYTTLLFLLPLIIIIFVLTAVFLSYVCAKQIYRPIDNIMSVLDNIKNSKSSMHEETDYDYLEIKYIVQNILDTFNDRQQMQTELEDKLKQLNNVKRYALQAQIQPHLIFNTLEIIYLEAYNQLGDDNIVSEMVCNLADLIRLSFRDENKFSTIENELLHAEKYIHIQSIRFEDMFKTVWDIDRELDGFLTPKIILQPIIENSIVHGIIPSGRFCTLTVKNYSENEDIVFIIKDDGIGMERTRLEQINSYLSSDELPQKNIGISNVNLRIKILFGRKYGCTVLSSDKNGTTVEIRIPKITP